MGLVVLALLILALFIQFLLEDGGGILFVILMAWFAALAMAPVVDRLSRRMKRGFATIIVMITFLLFAAFFLLAFGSLLVDQLVELASAVPGVIAQALAWANERLGRQYEFNASTAQREMFEHKIEERFMYAAKIHSPLDSSGKARFQCPALDNKIGCPRREGTLAMAMQEGLPIIQNPPEGPAAPRICTKQTFLVDIEEDHQIRDLMKNNQNPIWGTREWRKLYRRRTYIEGWFGTVKDTVGLKRRSIRLNGIAMNSLAISIYASLANRRHLQKWHQDTGLGPRTHPLLSESREDLAGAA